MASIALRSDESAGLLVAVVLHVALVAILLLQPIRPEIAPIPERMTVSLAEEVGPAAAAPEPVPESRAAIAPVIGDEPMPVAEQPAPVVRPVEPPRAAQPPPRRPVNRADRRRPEQSRSQSRPAAAPPTRSGGSRIGSDFLPGSGDSTRTEETRAPAPNFGPRERAALASAITRQLRPHWTAPSGVDSELLVSVIAWELNSDGSLKGRPRLVRQSGVNASNQPQAALHAERAIRAVQLAAPFNLPEEFYSRWDDLEWVFDRRL